VGGEVIGPWLHSLDQHLRHWIWLIVVLALVVLARLWLKRRENKRD
jgi:membrane protein DedA with SNARE-associated domain